jgi:hypothetical protein
MCSLIHEPAEPIERDEGGVRTRTLSGRVRARAPGLNAYLFALVRFSDYVGDPPPDFQRAAVWLEPTGDGWCSYRVTDRQARAAPGRRSRARG